MVKIVVPHPEKCTFCRYCELICPYFHEHVVNLRKSRINVIRPAYDLSFPVTCTHGYGCDKECIDACPEGAIRDVDGIVKIDEDLCLECASCVDACPFGAIKIYKGKAWKCDLCGGNPRCVAFCSQGALTYEDGEEADKQIFEEMKKVVEDWRKDYVLQL